MPNHITNVVQASSECLEALCSDGTPDFNALIPMPECLRGSEMPEDVKDRAKAAVGLCEEPGGDMLSRLTFSNVVRSITTPVRDDQIDNLVSAIRNYQQTGYVYWFDWCSENWGTKRNAYGVDEERCNSEQLHFETAWSMPYPVAAALSRSFPEESIVWLYADEDLGNNCGTMLLLNGEVVHHEKAPRPNDRTEDQERRWNQFSFELLHPGKDPSEFGFNERFERVEE